jgi:Xaa-Pro aminopeptidase
MKKDLDALMQAQNIDVLLVTGAAQHNPAMVYLTGGGHITAADLIKKRGEQGVLFCGMMEREEAARTGLRTIGYGQYPMRELFKQAKGNRELAGALRYQAMLKDLGITSGRVALYGQVELSETYGILSALQKLMPDMELLSFFNDPIIMQAMMTKDSDEEQRIRKMGKITTGVVGRVADFMTGHRVKNEMLVKPDGSPLTIGDVKRNIDLWLAEAGAENPEGTIFAIGHDAGVPHSTGTASDPMRLGQTIVFDIYPCEAGGGYFYDFTRTWCLGYAPDEAQKLYDDVLSVYNTVASELKLNTPFAQYQTRTCELFEALGHPTVLNTPETQVGYIHSLGHGVGLHIHEMPFSGTLTAGKGDILAPGAVFTSEPGLYYPDKGMGVRIEDTYFAYPDGHFEIMADFPKDLVLPVK